MLAFYALAAATLASAVSAANHTVIVGGAAGLKFTPEELTAEVDDFVTFIYQAKAHSVTQSPFASPCSLLQNATTKAVGFDSGFVPVEATATEFPAWTIQVTAKTPIWFFCKQGNHCQQGMVGSINAATTGDKTFAAFKALAMSGGGANGTSGGTLSTVASFVPSTTGVGAAGRQSTILNSSQVAAATGAASNAGTSTTGAANSNVRLSAAGSLLALVLAVFAVLA